MNKKLTIRECADAVIEIMRSLDYKDSSILIYQKLFEQFINYCDDAGRDVFDEMTAIEYAGIVSGKELKDLAEPDTYDLKQVVLLRSLRLLGEYSQSQTFTPRFRRFFEPFQDSPYWKANGVNLKRLALLFWPMLNRTRHSHSTVENIAKCS